MATIELYQQCPLQKRFASELFNKQILHVVRITTHEKGQLMHVDAIHVHADGSRNQAGSKFQVFTPERLIKVLLTEEANGYRVRSLNGVPFSGTYEDAFLILLESADEDHRKMVAYDLEAKEAAERLVLH